MNVTQHNLTVRDLRRRWKPHKERLLAARPDHSTPIRIHRAFSWLSAVEQMGEKPDYDMAILSQWIAFNSLYGQWDPTKQEPLPDRDCSRKFLDRILKLDSSGHIAAMLQEQRKLVMLILDDEFLSGYFWQEPTSKRAGQSKKAKYDAQTWYLQGNWTMISDRVLQRIYLLRCQLVHGASTHRSQLNRTALHRCSQMLGRYLQAVLNVIIDHGADEDWGPMCYPPLENGRDRKSSNGFTSPYSKPLPR